MARESKGGLRLRLFGFPVCIHPSFLFISVLVGLGSPGVTFTVAIVWTLVVLVSVLVHELGHAFAARGLGAPTPTIDLYLFGGVTAFVPPARMGRVGSIWVTLAGPLAGFALGGFVLSVAGAFGVDNPTLRIYRDASLAELTVSVAIYVNIVWGLVNLLPLMPLDGGNIIRNLLPGTAAQRARTAAIASVIIGVGLCLWLRQTDYSRMMVLPLLLVAVNLFSLFGNRADPGLEETSGVLDDLRGLDQGVPGSLDALAARLPTLSPQARDRVKVTAIEILVQHNRAAEARWALANLAGTAHPSSYALVETIDGQPAHGIAMLDDLFARAPSPPLARYALMARVLAGRAAEVPMLIAHLPPGTQDPDLLRELQHLAHVRGDFPGAVTIGESIVSAGGPVDAWVLYNIACSAARMGDVPRALGRLSHAIDAGWTDAQQLDRDQDLAVLWALPEFQRLRQRVASSPQPA